MDNKHVINIRVKGGIISPSHMNAILAVAEENGNKTIGFGSRQQILMDVLVSNKTNIEKLLNEKGYDFEWVKDQKVHHENIVSSFAAYEMLPSLFWVSSDTYLTALDQFRKPITLRVNITDPKQKLTPCYSGHLNFVASEKENYWHLAINHIEGDETYTWPVLVHQDDLGSLAYMLEKFYIEHMPLKNWYDESLIEKKFKNLESNLSLPEEPDLPGFYEGFNRMEKGSGWWAGYYWRNNQYSVSFLQEVCNLSLRTNIARIFITPWKSFLVKNIHHSDKILWEQLTGRNGINMRHSSFDLYWHLPFDDPKAFHTKRSIVRKMDKLDIRTYGLTYTVGDPEFPFTSVVIKPKHFLGFLNIPMLNLYDIYFAKNFDTRTGKYELANKNITFNEIHGVLIELSKRFYLKLSSKTKHKAKPKVESKPVVTIHQCSECLSVYHPGFGDISQQVPPGTAFSDLKPDYQCATCGAPKEKFTEKEMDTSMFMEPGSNN